MSIDYVGDHMMTQAIDAVAKNAIRHFGRAMHPQAVRIYTPFPENVAIDSCKMSPELRQLIEIFVPDAKDRGLYSHQAKFFKDYIENGKRNFIMTTSTGSGKSLCFWMWVFDHLIQDSNATAILCFPTQALMWSQAERLSSLSCKESCCFRNPNVPDLVYAGSVSLSGGQIPWTIWKGTDKDEIMKAHEKTAEFKRARIRIATLDKAHFSLLYDKEFLKNLSCLVLDEAHSYTGVFGANVHYFLKRLYASKKIKMSQHPDIFLASATLSSAKTFGKMLISLDNKDDICHIHDTITPDVALIDVDEIPKILNAPPNGGLMRIVLLVEGGVSDASLISFISKDGNIGRNINAIYFSESKFGSRLLRRTIQGNTHRRVEIYDANMPPEKRRIIERLMNDSQTKGVTLIGTSALELGVDIEGLDLCLMDDIPPRTVDLIQRIGRIGRRPGRPGLAILRITMSPHDQSILADPLNSFRIDSTRSNPLPLHLEMIRWRHLILGCHEWEWHINKGYLKRTLFEKAFKEYFPEDPDFQELKNRFKKNYGDLVDDKNEFWYYNGFRGTASAGSVPLIFGNEEIARIDKIFVFRDAHPEAIYLGHDGCTQYQVVDYSSKWSEWDWKNPKSQWILSKWLPSLESVIVKPVKENVATRGKWKDSIELYNRIDSVSSKVTLPKEGDFEFGVWDFYRKWDGYRVIDLDKKKTVDTVTLDEVTERFKAAINAGERFPFLYPYSYRTLGWMWRFSSPDGDEERLESLGDITAKVLAPFLADSLESRSDDIEISLDLSTGALHVIDAMAGGNGLSESLLTEQRIPRALDTCKNSLSQFLGDGKKELFRKYVLELANDVTDYSPKEILDVIQHLYSSWI
ncbi:DEAD/DEAH box helicase [uncultured archaeon]|nr:DEAD/DEAH box helicase [uncultured archaeon]